MITVSAVVKLMPRPPALVLTKNRKTSGSVLNWFIWKRFHLLKKVDGPNITWLMLYFERPV